MPHGVDVGDITRHVMSGFLVKAAPGVEIVTGCLQGLVSLLSNPVISDGVNGLATSATAFAAIEV